jgi:hypothetical protein
MFKIKPYTIDNTTNSIHFDFECDVFGSFSEVIQFPECIKISNESRDAVLHQLLDVMAAYLGVSYYKLSAETTIQIAGSFSNTAKQSIEKIYNDGLGEFYIRNELQYPPNISFQYSNTKDIQSHAVSDSDLRSVKPTVATVGFGGGKDSHVAMSMLEKMDINMDVVSVVLADTVKTTLQKLSDREIKFIKRQIDPKLISLVKQNKGYNGHIPITAINSMILSIYSYFVGNNWVVFSNERGASIPTMHHGSFEINHQYSKSIYFESLFRQTLNEICGDQVQYFSLLRPFSELWIASYLGRQASGVHEIFSSCNKNFIFEGRGKNKHGQRWCGKCSKCIYTSIILAPHISKEKFVSIFQGNILNDPDNLQMAKNLCGIGDSKPWECVGDFDDTAACLFRLSFMDEWKEDAIPKILKNGLINEYGQDYLEQRLADELSLKGDHFVPQEITQTCPDF